MNKTIYLMIVMFLVVIQIAFAQTGLFTSEGAGQFAVTGIIIVVIIIAFREVFNRMRKKK